MSKKSSIFAVKTTNGTLFAVTFWGWNDMIGEKVWVN